MAKRRSQRKSQRRSQHTKSDSGPRAPKTANTAPLSDEAIEQAKRNTLDIDDKLDEPETDSDEEDLEEDAQYTRKLQLSLAFPGRDFNHQEAIPSRPSLFLNRPHQPSTRMPSTGLAMDPTDFPSSPIGRRFKSRGRKRGVIEDSPTSKSPIILSPSSPALPTFSLATGIDRLFIEEVIEYCAMNAYDETLESLFKALEEDDMRLCESALDEMLEDEFDR